MVEWIIAVRASNPGSWLVSFSFFSFSSKSGTIDLSPSANSGLSIVRSIVGLAGFLCFFGTGGCCMSSCCFRLWESAWPFSPISISAISISGNEPALEPGWVLLLLCLLDFPANPVIIKIAIGIR